MSFPEHVGEITSTPVLIPFVIVRSPSTRYKTRVGQRTISAAICALLVGAVTVGQSVTLPNRSGSLKFAAIGDNGTGDQPQYDIAKQMSAAHQAFPFDLVIMLGDNMYGGQKPIDFIRKFEKPYADLLAAGVMFRASLGNHDQPTNVSYKLYNMDGRYYSYVRNNVRFIALDSTQVDAQQLRWVESTLRDAKEDWKICYFHHPLYSNAARHGSSVDLRVMLEPLFLKYGVNVVFTGHDHVYERVKPQRGTGRSRSPVPALFRLQQRMPARASSVRHPQPLSPALSSFRTQALVHVGAAETNDAARGIG